MAKERRSHQLPMKEKQAISPSPRSDHQIIHEFLLSIPKVLSFAVLPTTYSHIIAIQYKSFKKALGTITVENPETEGPRVTVKSSYNPSHPNPVIVLFRRTMNKQLLWSPQVHRPPSKPHQCGFDGPIGYRLHEIWIC